MALTYIESAQRMHLPSMNIGASKAFLADVQASKDVDKTIVCGFFRMEAGPPLIYDYHYEEMKIIVEGQMTISDETGKTVSAKPGDVFYFAKGSRITFASENYGIGFFCGQRKVGEA